MDTVLVCGLVVLRNIFVARIGLWPEILDCLINVADPCSDSEFRPCRGVLEVMSENMRESSRIDGSVCTKKFAIHFWIS